MSSFTEAQQVLAADALSRTSPAWDLFVDHDRLPAIVDLDTHERLPDPTD